MSGPLDADFAGAPQASVGFSSSIADNFSAAFDQAYRVDAMLGLGSEVQDRWADSLARFAARTGQPAHQADLQEIHDYFEPTLTAEGRLSTLKAFQGTNAFNLYSPGDMPADRARKLAEINQQIRELNDPNIPTLEALLDSALKNHVAMDERSQEVGESAGILGSVAGLAGGVAGSLGAVFAGRDPIQAISLAIGGGGKTAALRIGSEMLANAGAEAIVQETNIQPLRRELGLPEQSVLSQVVVAGLAGGVLRGAGEAAAFGARRLADRLRVESPDFSFDDPQLRQMFEAQPQDPAARAGISLLDDSASFSRANPYGETTAGYRRFTGEVSDIAAMGEGRQTAFAGYEGWTRAEPTDFTIENIDLDARMVQETSPLVFNAVRETSQALNVIDDRIAEVSSQLDNLSLADAVARIDADSGELVRSFEADIDNASLPRRQRELAAKQIDSIVETLGPDLVIRNLADAAIAPKKELQTLRKQRQAAANRFRVARNAYDSELSRLQNEQRIKSMMVRKVEPTAAAPIDPTALRTDVVEAQARSVDEAHEALPEYADSTLANMERNVEGEEALLDLGDGQLVDPKFLITDPENPAKEVTMQELYKRMIDDEAMLRAMTECSL